jgi:peptidoglycan/LPS O-acetylase OafA/YrhL
LALWHNPVADEDAWNPGEWQLAGAALLLIATIAIRGDIFRETVRYTLQGASLFVIFSYLLHDRGLTTKLLGSRPLKVVALLSYTLYLCHNLFFVALDQNFPQLGALERGIAGLLATFIYAGIIFLLVEKPIIARRKAERRVRSPRSLPVNPIG